VVSVTFIFIDMSWGYSSSSSSSFWMGFAFEFFMKSVLRWFDFVSFYLRVFFVGTSKYSVTYGFVVLLRICTM